MGLATTRPGGRRLVLLRHAKAEHEAPADELRPLALTGRRQCTAVGARLAASRLVPELVLVSSAVRTRQTWDLVRLAMGDVPEPDVDITDRLYSAPVGDVVTLLRGVDERVATVLVVGHEPTMSSTAARLAAAEGDRLDAAHLVQVRTGLPTAGYAVLELDRWGALDRGVGRLVDVVRPPR